MVKAAHKKGLAAASLLVLSLPVLGACAQTPDQIMRSNRMHTQLVAKEVTAELKIDTYVMGERLAEPEREAVKYFATAYNDEGHGAVVISRPTNGPDDVSAMRAASDARALLLAEGIALRSIVEGPYDATGARSAPLVISYKTWEASIGDCPDISHWDLSWTGTNSAAPSFGCAVASNLAAMIANPRELVAAADIEPADSARRMIVLSKYRNGEPTTAERADEGSGAISDVVE